MDSNEKKVSDKSEKIEEITNRKKNWWRADIPISTIKICGFEFKPNNFKIPVSFLVGFVVCGIFIILLFLFKPSLFDPLVTPRVQKALEQTLTFRPTFQPFSSCATCPVYNSYPTQTPAHAQSMELPETPESIKTPETTLVPTPGIESKNYCLDVETWRVFDKNKNISIIKDENDRECYNLKSQGIIGQQNNNGLIILNIDFSSQQIKSQGLVFPISSEWETELQIEIKEISSLQECSNNEICDVNLIIGIGDPTTTNETGKFVIFRAVSKNSEILVCELSNIYEPCYSEISKIKLYSLPAKFGLNIRNNKSNIEFILDDRLISTLPITAISQKFLWIGYNFRSSGEISSTIKFTKLPR